MPKLLMFAGSARVASANKILTALAAGIARKAGVEATLIDSRILKFQSTTAISKRRPACQKKQSG